MASRAVQRMRKDLATIEGSIGVSEVSQDIRSGIDQLEVMVAEGVAPPSYYTVAELAARLGVTRRAINHWVAIGKLKDGEDYYKIGSRARFPKEIIDRKFNL